MAGKTYLIQLKPLGKFAFGDGMQSSNGNRKNYFLHSNHFPQQTGVLGFIRHQLLLQNGLLKEGEPGISKSNQDLADQLIKRNGFDGSSDKFGIIEKISPVTIYRGDSAYYLRNKEIGIQKDNTEKPITLDATKKIIQNYNTKKGFKSVFINQDNKQLAFDDIYLSQVQTGIRMINKQVADDAYYIQESFKFSDNTISFGFYVTFDLALFRKIFPDKPHPLHINNEIVYFGKEKSPFIMSVSEKYEPINIWKYKAVSKKFLCISDVLITNNEIEEFDLVLGDITPFNYISTNNCTENHNTLSANDNRFPRFGNSVNTFLLKRGSIIYGSQDKINQLSTKTAFYNIGYNHLVPVEENIFN